MPRPKHIHFMGIAGSGISAVAQIAAAQGYQISGCDLNLDSPYLKSSGLQLTPDRLYPGHSPDHLKGVDLLAVTPAVFYQNNTHPEVETAKAKGILIKWQDFLGKYLHQGKYLISVAGTHGKSTTTSLAGLLLEAAGLDPTVEVGATVTSWHNNVRIGKSSYFISEADEFHDNFATYKSDVIILTLLEFDHPEFFGTPEKMLVAFQNFLDRLKPGGTVIYNSDSALTTKLKFPSNSLPYSLNQVENIELTPSGSSFSFRKTDYHLQLPGLHNISNSLAIINLAKILNIDSQVTISALNSFTGIDRRLQLLGQKSGVFVYDDYANHPSSFAATISAVRQLHPTASITAVIEPHTFSRLRVLLSQLPDAVKQADQVIVSKIYASRETDPGDFTGQDIVTALHHPNAKYIPEFSDIILYLKSLSLSDHVILVMGSGNSYKLSRDILANL